MYSVQNLAWRCWLVKGRSFCMAFFSQLGYVGASWLVDGCIRLVCVKWVECLLQKMGNGHEHKLFRGRQTLSWEHREWAVGTCCWCLPGWGLRHLPAALGPGLQPPGQLCAEKKENVLALDCFWNRQKKKKKSLFSHAHAHELLTGD